VAGKKKLNLNIDYDSIFRSCMRRAEEKGLSGWDLVEFLEKCKAEAEKGGG